MKHPKLVNKPEATGARPSTSGGARARSAPAASTLEIESYESSKLLARSTFARLVMRRANVAQRIKELEAEKAALNLDIGALLRRADRTATMVGDLQVSLVTSKRSTLDKQKLVELGVSAKTIARATKVTPSTTVRVEDVTKRGKLGAGEESGSEDESGVA